MGDRLVPYWAVVQNVRVGGNFLLSSILSKETSNTLQNLQNKGSATQFDTFWMTLLDKLQSKLTVLCRQQLPACSNKSEMICKMVTHLRYRQCLRED